MVVNNMADYMCYMFFVVDFYVFFWVYYLFFYLLNGYRLKFKFEFIGFKSVYENNNKII